MKTELAPTSSDLSLLPRADLPVIWDGFAAKAEQLRTTAETLTVTSVEQKAEENKPQTTRMKKCSCEDCGYVARTVKKWLDAVGAPLCPCNKKVMKVDLGLEEEEGE